MASYQLTTPQVEHAGELAKLIGVSPVTVGNDNVLHAYVEQSVLDSICSTFDFNKVSEIALLEIRLERDALLAASDWTQVADAPVDKTAWAIYRQALRDITSQLDLSNISWPVQPL